MIRHTMITPIVNHWQFGITIYTPIYQPLERCKDSLIWLYDIKQQIIKDLYKEQPSRKQNRNNGSSSNYEWPWFFNHGTLLKPNSN